MTSEAHKASIRALNTEAAALSELAAIAGPSLAAALELLIGLPGRLIVSGIGKSGHIGAKIAATLASTGTPSFFVHATEALHGDSGMVVEGDVVLLISNSGTTAEVFQFGQMLAERGIPIVAMTRDPESKLALIAKVHIPIGAFAEADPLDLAPSTSTTSILALGDALAVGLMTASKFSAEDFARFHPGGALGERLKDEKENL